MSALRDPWPHALVPRVLGLVGISGLCVLASTTSADAATVTTYRCDVEGRMTYQDVPCASGRQSPIAASDPVDPADRAAAVDRARSDRSALAALDRSQARTRDEDRKAAAATARSRSDRDKQAHACAKLGRRARDARDAFDIAGPREQPRARLKSQHADADYAAFCKK